MIEVRASDIEEILNVCLRGTGLTYVIQDAVIVLKPVIEDKKTKKIKVAGKVTDEKKVPLPGVTVLIKGTTLGTGHGCGWKILLVVTGRKEYHVGIFLFKHEDPGDQIHGAGHD